MYYQMFSQGQGRTTPNYFQATATRGIGEYFETGQQSPQAFRDGSLGALSVFDFASPAAGALKFARMNGLGADEEVPVDDSEAEPYLYGPLGLAIVAGVLLLGGWFNYVQGKAMAPSSDKAKKWGWIAVPVGFLPLGLPIMAMVSNAQTNR